MLFASDAKSFVIGLPESTLQGPYQMQLENAFNLLYLGIEDEVSFAYLPFNRMMRMMQDEQLDAVAYQLNFQAGDTLGMMRIPEPLTQLKLYLGCLEENHCIFDKGLRFVVNADSQYTNQICERLSLNCLVQRTPELAHKALKEGIVDAYIMQRSPHITEPCLLEIGIKAYPIADTEINIYHFIKRSHSNIAQQLAERLKNREQKVQYSSAQEC
jgi:hypothetical protein